MSQQRPIAKGKWLFVGDEKFLVKGVTYGTFKPNDRGDQFPEDGDIRSDLKAMAAAGFNTVRTYTPPPVSLLDAAVEHGLRVLVGLPWEQHTTFLDRPDAVRKIRKSVRETVDSLAGHPAVLGYAVGNEIPASIVRWHGADAIQNFIRTLYDEVKSVDPGALVTYVNYPTTEYLTLPFLDFFAFNVFLEEEAKLEAYLARLHNQIGDAPLVLTEVGLDSRRNGLEAQAESIEWQTRTVFTSGCAGVCLFAWTDEWWRGGYDIEDWDFGLVTRERAPKPALEAASATLSDVPIPSSVRRPFFSVVVATKNGAGTIDDTLAGLSRLNYPNYEVIVVNDSSGDNTREIAENHGVRVVDCEGVGLSDGRNTGMRYANGEIVAFIDDDAYPDPDWLSYLAYAYETTDFAAIGGPNVIPENSGSLAQCVANSPGGPVHVLLDDRIAEHIPGCNMSFRKAAIEAIGGFDSRFRAAGDDVDVCWRIQNMGWQIGFHPGALVWHYRRNSLRGYWRQQKGYGKAEALLENKWPTRYNRMGHIAWGGQIYGPGLTESLFDRRVIYQGIWGSAPFQGIYTARSNHWGALPLMPEWLLLVAALFAISMLGLAWSPLLVAVPILLLAIGFSATQAVRSSGNARFPSGIGKFRRWRLRALVSLMHLVQPLARLTGRIKHGLTLWRRRGLAPIRAKGRGQWALWSETWRSSTDWLEKIETALNSLGVPSSRANAYSRWDIDVRGGVMGSTRLLLAVEEHGAGKQMVRVKYWPQHSIMVGLSAFVFGLAFIPAVAAGRLWIAGGAALGCLAVIAFAIFETRRSAGATEAALAMVGDSKWADETQARPEARQGFVVVNGVPVPGGGDGAPAGTFMERPERVGTFGSVRQSRGDESGAEL